jgi:hypothetical protein
MPTSRDQLRRRDELVATGQLTWEEALEVGDRITIGAWPYSYWRE